MNSQQEILDIICTEAIEHVGLQERPEPMHVAKPASDSPAMDYPFHLVREADGTLRWTDIEIQGQSRETSPS